MKLARTLLLLPLVLVACGGGAATTSPTGAAATTNPAGTTPGGTTPAATGAAPTSGGGTAIDWCLNTPPEVEAAIHVMGVVATGSGAEGIGGGCTYSLSTGILVHAISVITTEGFAATFEASKQTPGAVEIAGIGNGAVLISPQGPLAILTDRGLISMGPIGPADLMADPAAYRTAVEALGRAAVERMP
jgi:hypothetical protein